MSAVDDALVAAGMGDFTGQNFPTDNTLGFGNIYMGRVPGMPTTLSNKGYARVEAPLKQTDIKNYMSLSDARVMPYNWSDKEREDFIHSGIMRKIPGFNENMGLPDILSQWDDWIKLSSDLGKQGIEMSPFDIMNTYKSREGQTYKKGNWEYDAVTDQPVKYVGPLTKTDTQTRVDLSTREDALALAKTSMAQMLGRSPTTNELTNYLNLLNGFEREHPTTSTTTSTISPETGEVVSSATQTQGGVTGAGRQALLEEKMGMTPEHASYAASTTYFSAMMQELMRGY
jgi:hypothetical protein